ncbi:MAG TPA: UDP-N-acetylmuramate dehydrogenase [Vicinamibacterales bacterium]|nr:UDP-N-acetylmuramate dehydrogenase [Vicinamibacterales bacterium]
MTGLEASLRAALGGDRVRMAAPLAAFTTFRVGGAADCLVEARTAAEARRAIELARAAGVAVTVLGGGSNVLVADDGVRGLVIRVHGGEVVQLAPDRIRADAGVTINGLVRWTINRGLAGLEAWAGTPGTVGGAVHGNAHFQGRLIGDLVRSVSLVDGGRELEVDASEMEFGYDYSRLHHSGEIVLAAQFAVGAGDPAVLRAVARESLAFRKRTQPLESASAGCIFQNPDPARDAVPDGIPPSAGALVDRAGLKGARVGRARVSTTHANFIVNEGGATAADIRSLIARCKDAVRERFGVALREEIVYVGFD